MTLNKNKILNTENEIKCETCCADKLINLDKK